MVAFDPRLAALGRSRGRRADRRPRAPGAGDGRPDQPPAPLRRSTQSRSRSASSSSATPPTAPTRSTAAAARRPSCTPSCSAMRSTPHPERPRAVALALDRARAPRSNRSIAPRCSPTAKPCARRKAVGRARFGDRLRQRFFEDGVGRRDALRPGRLPRLRAHVQHARDAREAPSAARRSSGARCASCCAASDAIGATPSPTRPIARRPSRAARRRSRPDGYRDTPPARAGGP